MAQKPNPRKEMLMEALLGSVGNLGVDPSAVYASQYQDYVRAQQEEARDESRGMSAGTKVLKSIGGAVGGPAAMAAPWLSKTGRTPADPFYSLSSSYGSAGMEGQFRADALRGKDTSGSRYSIQKAGEYMPTYTAFKGAVTPNGLAPEALGRGGLIAALSALSAGMLSPGAYVGSTVGSEAGARVAAHNSSSPYAPLVGAAAGGALGGSVGKALVPTAPAGGNPLGVAGEVLQFPNQLIPGAQGQGAMAEYWNLLKSNLPNVGTTGRDLMSGLNMRRTMKEDARLANIRQTAPNVKSFFGIPEIPSLGSVI